MKLSYANTRIAHMNPGAKNPLILPVRVICNTSDERLYCNVHTNSHAAHEWLKQEPAHDGVALLCGSGPSINDDLDTIRKMQAAGAKVFALNGCAGLLFDNGILPDYQVILDARAETGQLIGPARKHLFASQVAPELFDAEPDAMLWQLQIEGIDHVLPDEYPEHALIGGAASVGNTATCIAYTMGYRELHCFGYDSSHRDGKGHAFHQKMNDGDPCCIVKFNGKEYTASLTMKLQAEKFMDTAAELDRLGCRIEMHGEGLLPDIFRSGDKAVVESERSKYETLWQMDGYRDLAPGEGLVDTAVAWLGMKPGTLIDFGIGTGRAAKRFQRMGFDVRGVDIAPNCLDAGVDVPVHVACLWELPDLSADYGYCTDVMEHIPPQHVDAVINNVMRCVPEAFFNISLIPDNFGEVIGEVLHLSVHSAKWWRNKFESLGYEVPRLCENPSDALFHIRRGASALKAAA